MTTILRTALTLVLAASATIATVGIATPVLATDAPTTTISVPLHNLGNPAVRARLDAAVRRAAKRICTSNGHRPTATMMAERACVDTAIANALPQVEMLAACSAGGMVAAATVPTKTVSQ
ncbi:UrcA family protein [Sandarakinorhabdus sp. DWP1-3-1]|uniref:UrcA family protein n=1 Tax=Sandarakinorhabdus sp. DWP1-3-1 TaxID=2804627 RepID=UPI003CE8ECF2